MYTKTQRLKITTGENLLANGDFSDQTQMWNDADGNDIDAETWMLSEGAGPNGENVLESLGSNEGKALCRYYPMSVGTYLVTFQIKGTAAGSTSVGTTVGANYADIFVNTTGSFIHESSTEEAPVVDVATSVSFNDEWTTVNFFVECTDEIESLNKLVFHFEKMATGVMVTNFGVYEAEEVYDIRGIERLVSYANLLLADPNFNVAAASDEKEAVESCISQFESMKLANVLDNETTAEAFIAMFEGAIKEYLDRTSFDIAKNSYFQYVEDIREVPSSNRGNLDSGAKVGGFLLRGSNWFHQRGMDESGQRTLLDNPYWTKYIGSGNANGAGSIALWNDYMPAGKYFVAAEMRNCNEVKAGKVWDLECAVKGFVGTSEVELGTIKGEDFVKLFFVAELKEGEAFEAGFYWDGPESGSTFQIGDFEIRSFEDVEEQIARKDAWQKFIAQYNAMIGARNKLLGMIGNPNYPWNQARLTDAKAEWDPRYEEFMAKGWVDANGNDTGVATIDELTDWATTTGITDMESPYDKYALVRGYQYATNEVIADNKPITDLAEAIDAAKKTRNSAANATGDRETYKTAILAAIESITSIRANTTDETREGDTILLNAALETLNEATAAFLASVSLKPIVDIDFSNAAVEDFESGETYVDGTEGAGRMVFTNFNMDNTADDQMFTIGRGTDVENVLRIGNGSATVAFDAPGDEDKLDASFDLWIGGLTGKFVYVELQNAESKRVAGFRWQIYNGAVGFNDFDNEANEGMNLAGMSTGTSKNGDAQLYVDNFKYSFTLSADYKTQTVQGKLVCAKGTVSGQPVAMNAELEDNKIVKFVVGSDYNSAPGRRSWFDNLRISKFQGADFEEDITESPWAEETQGIQTVNVDNTVKAGIYNLQGQKMEKTVRGLYIINGKKYIVK